MNLSKMVSIAEAASILEVSRQTVYNFIHAGALPEPQKYANAVALLPRHKVMLLQKRRQKNQKEKVNGGKYGFGNASAGAPEEQAAC